MALIRIAILAGLMVLCSGQTPAVDIVILGGTSSASGSSGGGCTNQLVLVYSNSCALIGQAWGE